MRTLIAIPSYSNSGSLRECLDSVVARQDVDVLVLENGATQEVKYILNEYQFASKITLWHNQTNEYVNKPWSDFINHFLKERRWSHLCIMNDDLVLQENWFDVVRARWSVNPDEILLPVITEDKSPVDTSIQEAAIATMGTPGFFVTMNLVQAELAKDFPHQECKLWFFDEFYFTLARAAGYQTIIPQNFKAYHGWSKTMDSLPGKSGIVEQDKVKWLEYVEPLMQERIKKLKDGTGAIKPNS